VVAALLHISEDGSDSRFQLLVGSFFESEQRTQARIEIGLLCRESGDVHLIAPAKASSMGCMVARLSFSEAWFTTRREEICTISSTATRLLAFSVAPLLTKSTMASDNPTSGANSMEPYSLIK